MAHFRSTQYHHPKIVSGQTKSSIISCLPTSIMAVAFAIPYYLLFSKPPFFMPSLPGTLLLPDPVLATQNLPGHPQTSWPPPHLYLCYSSTVSGVFELPATPRLNHSLLRPKLQLPGCNWPLRGCPVTLLALPDSPEIWSAISSRTPEITIGPQFHPFANNSIGSGRPAMRTCPIDPDWSHDPGV